ncbi:MAG: PQQ-binding-like beta-propeller repeat protein [Burkholderiales bacterium]|nr:PQQ-binding-like beta-propeller repeat protein [Burkholderiales bacterium]
MSATIGRWKAVGLSVALAGLVGACGGGGGSAASNPAPPPAPSPSYAIGGQVIGLQAGQSVQVANAAETIAVQANGGFAFGNKLASGAAYAVSIVKSPAGRRCAVDRATGIVATGDVQSIVVNCTGVVNWVPDGSVTVTALSADGSTVYIGGGFSHIGARTGSFVAVDPASGQPTVTALVQGSVIAAASDGAGGWYLGGSFISIGTTAQRNLAHVRADGSLDDRFTPGFTDPVSALAFDGSKLYVATHVIGQGSLYALDPAGNATRIWRLTSNSGAQALALDAGILYVAGSYSQIGNLTRYGLAAVDTATGTVIAGWDAQPNNGAAIYQLQFANGRLYLAGAFSSIGGAARVDAAALDPTTATAVAWNPVLRSASGLTELRAMAIVGSTVYLGGTYDSVEGQARPGLAAVSLGDASLLPWSPALAARVYGLPGYVNAMTATASTVYVSGVLAAAGAASAQSLAALDAASGALRPWVSGSQGSVQWLAAAGSGIWLGGSFGMLGGVDRAGLAALDITTGQPTAWNPAASNSSSPGESFVPTALAVAGSRVYVAGDFDTIGGTARSGLAALDPTTGAALGGWNPLISGRVGAMAATDTTLYVSGVSAVDGQARAQLAAIDAATGHVTPWAPDASQAGTIAAMVHAGSAIYIVGPITSLAGRTRSGAAAFDAASGALLPWDPELTLNGLMPRPTSVAASGGTIYVAGPFNLAGGTPVNGVAALDASTGAALPWPAIRGGITVAAMGDDVYLGQMNPDAGYPPLPGLVTLSALSGQPTSLQYNLDGAVYTVAVSPTTIVVGGSFGGLLDESQPMLAILPR